MREKIDVPVSVGLYFNHKLRRTAPVRVDWEGREYRVSRIGMKHSYRRGRTLYHVFSVVAGPMFFRLVMNGDTLQWRLEEVSDGF